VAECERKLESAIQNLPLLGLKALQLLDQVGVPCAGGGAKSAVASTASD